jgi:large subunit ribosomal protein L22
MAFGTKTNERPGTRAQVRYVRSSAYKAREVLDLIRGLPVDEAADVLRFTERGVSEPIAKLLTSAIANAEHNDEQDASELFISACFADEGPTLKRWRPRARGRATRIRKRTCHITLIVGRMSPEQLARRSAKAAASVARGGTQRDAAASRRARVAKSRGEAVDQVDDTASEDIPGEPTEDTIDQAEQAEAEATEAETTDEAAADEIPGEPTDETIEQAETETEDTDDQADEVGEPTEAMVEDAKDAADDADEETK